MSKFFKFLLIATFRYFLVRLTFKIEVLIAHKPWRNPEVEALLTGKPATRENFQLIAEAYLQGAQGYGDNTFKIELAKRAIVRALTQATQTEAK